MTIKRKPMLRSALQCVPVFTSLLAFTAHTHATDYNDPYWASPNANTDFVDHFNTPSINRDAWKVESDIFVNGEDIDYQDVEYPAQDWTLASGQFDSGAVDNNVLILKARYMDGQVQDVYGGDPENPGKPLFIRSGRIESQITDATTFTYGKFEARIKNPPARNGEFPAWWLLGNFPDVGWTACQELDIMEFTGNNGSGIPQTHWTAPYAVHGSFRAPISFDSSQEFATYGIIKTPSKVEWYINGVLTKTFSRENQGDDQPWPYVTPMRMILNHAITHVEWPDVGNYNLYSPDPNVANRTGWSYVDGNGVTQYEYIDTASMAANIGRNGTDFVVDYVAHWPLPDSDPEKKYTAENKRSFFRESNNTDGFYNLKGWLAPVAVTGDDYDKPGWDTDARDNAPDNAADGYVGSKWATPNDDNVHWIEIDYGADKQVKYLWLEWAWNLPSSYDIYAKSEATGNWEYLLTSDQDSATWATHTFDVNRAYRYFKVITKGRIDKGSPIWLLEFKAFEDVADVYPKPEAGSTVDRTVNVLSNGDFSDGVSGWASEAYDGANPNFDVINGAVQLSLTNAGANEGSVQLHTSGFGLKRDYRYHISFDARANAPRSMVARLSEDTLNPSIAGTYLHETVNLGTSMNTYDFTLDFSAGNNPGRLAFLFGNMGTAGVTIDNVVIREGEYIGSSESLVPVIGPADMVGTSAGWETEWWGVAARAIDGSAATKASGNDGQSEGQDLSLSVRIGEHYEIQQVWISGDNSPDRSLDQFRVEYGNGNVLMDWTPSTTEGQFELFDQLASLPPVGERNFTFFFRPPAGQLVELTDVQLMAIDHRPHRISAVALDEGVTISPAGTLRYSMNNTDDATYSFVAPAGKSIGNVIIDGVSMGPITSYTFNNISASHSIAVGLQDSGTTPPPTPTITPTPTPTTDPDPTLSNIALQATVSASSELQSATLAVDGQMGSRWESAHGVDPASLTLDFGEIATLDSATIHWEAANAAQYRVEGSVDANSWSLITEFNGGQFGNRTDNLDLNGSYRYLRIVGLTRSEGNSWGYSIFEVEVMGSFGGDTNPNPPEEQDLAIASASASSNMQPANLAVDGNAATRWESAHGVDDVSLTFTLDASHNLTRIELDWEAANAQSYDVLGSSDGVNWTLLNSEYGGSFGNRTDTVQLAGQYRYVRLQMQARSDGNLWGYSIFETRIFGY